VQARLPPNAPLEDELNFRWREIVASLSDRRLWMFTAIWATQTVGTYVVGQSGNSDLGCFFIKKDAFYARETRSCLRQSPILP
jgi:hypothetical protein